MIRLRTLGGLDLLDSEGRELRALLAQPKRLALLTYLAVATPRGFHRRDTLLALFWPEHDSEHARNSLSQAVHVLRRHLGPEALSTTGDTIGLERGALWCDALAFEEALDRGRHAEALELYRGALLEGFHVSNAPEFEGWLRGERGRLAERWAKAVAVAAEERESAADFAGAATFWRRLAAHDPYSSRVALRLMRALASAGDAAAALAHARVHETLLQNELGIPTDPEVGLLVRQLQSAPAPAASERPGPTSVAAVEVPRVKPEAPSAAWGRVRFAHRRAITLTAGVLGLVVVAVLVAGERHEPAPSGPEARYVMDLYEMGRKHELTRSEVSLSSAKQYYLRSIEQDHYFAPGYAGLARVYELMAFYNFAPIHAALESSAIMARTAMALDSTLPESRSALGVALTAAGKFGEAERQFKRAIQLDSANAQAHYWYSMLLVALGRGSEARDQAQTGLDLDPLSPRAALGMKWSAEYLISGKRSVQKLPVKDRWPILQRETGEPWALMQEAIDLAEAGRCDEADANAQRATQIVQDDNLRMLMLVGSVYWECGEPVRARDVLARIKQHPEAADHGGVVAVLHARFASSSQPADSVAEIDSAFVWLGRQQRWTLPHLAALSANRFMDPLRKDPRFAELMQQVGIR